MQYECKIIKVVDDEEVTIQIHNIQLVGFVNNGCEKKENDICIIDISLYDDLEIKESEDKDKSIIRRGNSYAYQLKGVLDTNQHVLHSEIDFDINEEDLWDYGYLDGKYVSIDVLRVDFELFN